MAAAVCGARYHGIMWITLSRTLTGSLDGQDWPPVGGTVEVPDAEGEWLVSAGYAAPAPAPKSEQAPAPKAEAPGAPRPVRRKRR